MSGFYDYGAGWSGESDDYGDGDSDPGAWSDTSAARLFDSKRAPLAQESATVRLYDPKGPRKLLEQIKDHHTHVRTGWTTSRLGQDDAQRFLTGLRERAPQLVSFQARSMKRSTFNPVPIIVDNLLLLPNLTDVELNFHINAVSCQALIRLLAHPRLERLAIQNHEFEHATLHDLLVAIKASIVLPHSRLRHLCFAGAKTRAAGKAQLAEDLLALLELGKDGCGREGGIEYLDLENFSVFGKKHFERLGHLVDMRNTTFQAIKLSDRRLFESGDLDGEEMMDNLVENQGLRRETQSGAKKLLPVARTLYLQPGANSTAAPPQRASLQVMPEEMLSEIVGHLKAEALNARQLSNIILFAADRKTLDGTVGSKDFLHKVDCWKYDSERGGRPR